MERNFWPIPLKVKEELIFSDTYTTANPGSMNLHNSEFILVTNTYLGRRCYEIGYSFSRLCTAYEIGLKIETSILPRKKLHKKS
jgi:hypothetical protein